SKLLDGDRWYDRFAADPELRRDSDRDGWSDVMEAYAGTDPHNKDTDGDGLPDSVDKNPLAAPGLLTDYQAILGAAVQGLMRFVGNWSHPIVVHLPAGVAPFEMFGVDGPILARTPETKVRTRNERYALLSVQYLRPRYGFDGEEVPFQRGGDPLLWNADHTEARVAIRGGLDR